MPVNIRRLKDGSVRWEARRKEKAKPNCVRFDTEEAAQRQLDTWDKARHKYKSAKVSREEKERGLAAFKAIQNRFLLNK